MTDKTGLQEPDRVVFFFIPEYHLLFSQDLKKKKRNHTAAGKGSSGPIFSPLLTG